MSLITRNRLALFKKETTPGTYESMSASADAVKVENLSAPQFSPTTLPDNSASGSLDDGGSRIGGMTAQITFDVKLKGSGTAGVAPEWGKLMKACGYQEVLIANPVPSSAEACAASGGSETVAVLGSSASATADAYFGAPVLFAGDNAGIGHVIGYTSGKAATLAQEFGDTFDADVTYQVQPCAIYIPASPDEPDSLSFRGYYDGIYYDLKGLRGTVNITCTSGGEWVASFTMSGTYHAKGDAAVPASPVFDATLPPIWKGGELLLDRVRVAAQQLSIASGVNGTFPDNPNEVEAYDPYEITRRRMTGSINPKSTLVATRDAFADFRAGTERIILARAGSVAGNRIALMVPAARYQQSAHGDRDGLMIDDISFEPIGFDSGVALVAY